MDTNGEIPWSCLAPGGAWKAEIWHTSDETAVLARRLAAASPAILAPSRVRGGAIVGHGAAALCGCVAE